MSTHNALGFFILGLVMMFLPALLPAYFMVKAMDGSNTSELWLCLMGGLQGALGISCIIRNEAVPFAIRLMTLRLPTLTPAERNAPALILRPLRSGGYMGGQGNEEQRLAA